MNADKKLNAGLLIRFFQRRFDDRPNPEQPETSVMDGATID